jgi:predicted nucleotidyltransferase
MAKRVNQVIEMRDIKEYITRLVQLFHPQKVILFGSYAYGQPEGASDVDILVIMDTSLRPVEQAIEIRKAVKSPFPLDLLVRTPEQIEERLSLGDFFIKEMLTRGKVIYEATD